MLVRNCADEVRQLGGGHAPAPTPVGIALYPAQLLKQLGAAGDDVAAFAQHKRMLQRFKLGLGGGTEHDNAAQKLSERIYGEVKEIRVLERQRLHFVEE